jgi:hypothetical protein
MPGFGYNMRMHFNNFGWLRIQNATIKFNLIQPDDQEDFGRVLTQSLTALEDKDGYISLNLAPIFEGLGVDVATLANRPYESEYGGDTETHKIREKNGTTLTLSGEQYKARVIKARGPFPQGAARIFGQIEFANPTNPGNVQAIKFVNIVVLGEQGPGAPAPPSFQYNVKFQVEGQNYERRVALAQALKPGDYDRFTIQVAADSSSTHHFDLRLVYNDGKVVQSPVVDLKLFMPRGSEHYLRDAK